jgi:hypothetical protein
MARTTSLQGTPSTRPCIKCGGTERTKRGDCKNCAKLFKKNWYQQNKKKSAEYKKLWLVKHPDRSNEFDLKVRVKRYGITVEDFQRMFTQQSGLCAICCNPLESIDIDHDHVLKLVRGLLCRQCNIGLGFFQDSPAILSRAIQYLIQSRNQEPSESVEGVSCTST